ncbi:putative cationic amino acid transporter [Ixodes scapularis]
MDTSFVERMPQSVVVIMGAVCGMATVLMGNMFALTRIVYAMAEDGLLFSWFSWVNARTQLPLAAMYAFTSLSAVLAVLLDINTLVEMMSIGTLLAYLVVSASLIIVRYMPLARLMGEESQELPDLARPTLSDESVDDDTGGRLRNSFSFLYTLYPFDQPPGIVVSYSITVLTVTVFILGFLTPLMVAPLADGSVWAVLALLLLLGVALASFGIILLFQQSSATVRYKMPLVPLLPTLSIIINATLMTTLQPLTWARLVIWIAVGRIVFPVLDASELCPQVVVIMGAVCGMATVLMGNMFALTRIVYAMAEDGLLFSWFSWVNARTQLPLAAMYAFTSLSAVLAVLLDINTLVEMMSIGTLLAYLVVSASLIIVRYMPLARLMGEESQELPDLARPTLSDESVDDDTGGRLRNSFSFLYTLYPFDQPPGIVVSYSITVLTVTVFILGFLTPLMVAPLADGSVWAVLALLLLLGVALASFGIILLFQQSSATVRYKMPLVPLLPTLSIIINATLMTTLQPLTWARLVIWIAVGLLVYFSYGMRHSKLNPDGVLSPRSSLLSSQEPAQRTWGALDKELSVPGDNADAPAGEDDDDKRPLVPAS